MSMTQPQTCVKPRVAVVGAAYPGYHLGEEMADGKFDEVLRSLGRENLELIIAPALITDTASARAMGQQLAAEKPDCLLVMLATFIPDYFIVELLHECDVPIFLWAIEREIDCLAMVCGPLITASLYNLHKQYRLLASDIPDETVLEEVMTFARAAMLRRLLREMRVGYIGGKPPIMFSTAVDEYMLADKLGLTVVHIPVDDLYQRAESFSDTDVCDFWSGIIDSVGCVAVADTDGMRSSRLAMASLDLAREHGLHALSINCFPHLKSQICLGVACLNDAGIAAACEGDLHSTILMYLLQALSGRASFNGDILRLYPVDNSILFSHCGAGAFSLASCPSDVCLHASIETHDGLAVKYPTSLPGPVSLFNLMMGRGTLRMIAMTGEGMDTDLTYEGTPLRVAFTTDVQAILQGIARSGAGHHWNGCPGNRMEIFRLLWEWLDLPYTCLTK